MSRDLQDAVVDQLLRELLGGDRPRDLTDRVLQRAKAYDRVRRRWWAGTAAAMAACVGIAAGLWAAWPQAYPVPQVAEGTVLITNGAALERGARVETPDDDRATLTLGGYVNVTMEPQTALTIAGARSAEKVLLEQGQVQVAVAKKHGSFDVVVGSATVHVTGTRFKVGVEEKLLEKESKRVRNLRVAVDEGSVVVGGVSGREPVTLGPAAGMREETFLISTEPLKIETPKTAPERPVPGMVRGALQGRAFGMRGPQSFNPIPRVQPVRPAAPGGGGTGGGAGGAGPAAAPLPSLQTRPVEVVLQEGRVELSGTLRKEKDYYYLETDNHAYLLYMNSPPANTPLPGRRVHVVWDGGRVKSIELDNARVPANPVDFN
jgi:hypothetical protein